MKSLAHLSQWRAKQLQLTVNLSNHPEATKEARNIEKNIYQTAASRDAYDEAWRAKLASLIPERLVDPPVSEEIESNNEALLPVAVTIGKYVNATHHRDGLFSQVYKARVTEVSSDPDRNDVQRTRLVALKVTTPDMMEEPHDSEREVRILQTTKDDHVIPLLEAFQQAGGRLVLVFPFMPFDLAYMLHEGLLNPARSRSHLHDMFSALAFIHAAGIVHRDVKPSNILLKSAEGPAYLADFGIAWSSTDVASEEEHSKITDVGTTCYRPPELLFGNTSYGTKLDMWAAGCVVAEATSLSAETLFDPGALGSELALISSIFKSLGTPTLKEWPEAAHFHDWGKFEFHQYPPKPWNELLPEAPSKGRSLVEKLVRYESGERLPASEALLHPYFRD